MSEAQAEAVDDPFWYMTEPGHVKLSVEEIKALDCRVRVPNRTWDKCCPVCEIPLLRTKKAAYRCHSEDCPLYRVRFNRFRDLLHDFSFAVVVD